MAIIKVKTGSIGPDGKPIFDIFEGTKKIDLARFKQLNLNIERITEGPVPTGADFVSEFKPVAPPQPTPQQPTPQPVPQPALREAQPTIAGAPIDRLAQLRQEKRGQIFDPVSGQIFGSATAPLEVLERGQLLKPGERGTIPAPTPVVTDIVPTGEDVISPVLITPTAPDTQEAFITGLQGQVETLRTQLENELKNQQDEIEKRLKEAQDEFDRIEKQQKDVIEKDVQPLLQPFREAKEAAERERLKVEENFFANQALVNELDTLLTEGNTIIQQMKGVTGLAGIRNPRINKAIEDVAARVGVIQSVMSARNGQIAQAYSLIDRSLNAITADRQDRLAYYNTLLSFYDDQKDVEGKKLISLERDKKDFMVAQINLIESDLAQAQANVDYIKDLMRDPNMAEFMAQAGINLNMTPEEVNRATADQTYTLTVRELHKEQEELGWEWIPTPAERDALPVGTETKDVRDGRGAIHTYKRVAVGVGADFTPTQKLKLEQVGLANAPRQQQLNFLFGDDDEVGVDGLFVDAAGNQLTPFEAAQVDVAGNPDLSDNELKSSLLEKYTGSRIPIKQRLTISQINSIITTRKQPQKRQEDIQKTIFEVLFKLKDLGFGRSEAKTRMESEIKKSLGLGKDDSIPDNFKDFIKDSLVSIFGQTFFQKIIPGGR